MKERPGWCRFIRGIILRNEVDLVIVTGLEDLPDDSIPELDGWIREIAQSTPSVRILLAGAAGAALELSDSVHCLADQETVLVEELALLIHAGRRLQTDAEDSAGTRLAWLSPNHLNFLVFAGAPALTGQWAPAAEGFDYPTAETVKALQEGCILATAEAGAIRLEPLPTSV